MGINCFNYIENFNLEEIIRISNRIRTLKRKKGSEDKKGGLHIFSTYELGTIIELLQIEATMCSADFNIFQFKPEYINNPKKKSEYRLYEQVVRNSHSFLDLTLAEIRSKELYRFELNQKSRSAPYSFSTLNDYASETLAYIIFLDIAHGFLVYDNFEFSKEFNLVSYLLAKIGFSAHQTEELYNHLILKKIELLELELRFIDEALSPQKSLEIMNSEEIKESLKKLIDNFKLNFENEMLISKKNFDNIVKRIQLLLESNLSSIFLKHCKNIEDFTSINDNIKNRTLSKYFRQSQGYASQNVIKFYDFSLLIGEFVLIDQKSNFDFNKLRNSTYLASLDCYSNSKKSYTLVPFNFLQRLKDEINSKRLNIYLTIHGYNIILNNGNILDIISDAPFVSFENVFEDVKSHFNENSHSPQLNANELEILLNKLGSWLISKKITQDNLNEITKLISDYKKNKI